MNKSRKSAVIRDFDRAAKNYDNYAYLQRDVVDFLFSMIREKLDKRSFVLDAGCGTGYFHELLRKNKIYCPLVQTDISPEMCKKAAEYASPPEYGGVYTFASDIEDLPIKNAVFDMIFSSLTLQWAENMENAVFSLETALKMGGTLAISTLGEGTLRELRESFAEMDDLSHVNENLINKNSLQEILEKAGFSKITITDKIIIKYYKNLREILYSVKGVGASYKPIGERKYLGKTYFFELEKIYQEKFGENGRLPVSWNVVYVVAIR